MSEPNATPVMRWWGWGDPEHPPALPEHALGFLRETVGIAARPAPPVALERVRLDGEELRALYARREGPTAGLVVEELRWRIDEDA